MRYPALLFDLDGTLVDSSALICSGLRAALSHLRLPARSEQELSSCIGLPLVHVWNRLGVQQHLHAEAAVGYRAWMTASGNPQAQPFPGTEALLRELHANGCMLVLATAKDSVSAKRALDRHGWTDIFSGAAGAEPTDGPDKRQVIARALAHLPDHRQTQAVMIGDMPHDGDAASHAGIPFIACTWGCSNKTALVMRQPVFTANSTAELADFLYAR